MNGCGKFIDMVNERCLNGERFFVATTVFISKHVSPPGRLFPPEY